MGRISVTRSARFARGSRPRPVSTSSVVAGFYRDQRFDILARHKAAAHRLAEFVQDEHVDLRDLLAC